MSSRRQISKFLRKLRAEGRFDSSGNFTVELKRALQKSSRYELKDFESAVLKLVQAGVAGEAKELVFSEGSGEIVFFARQANWSRAEVFESIYRPGSHKAGGTRQLGQALRYLLNHCPTGVLIEFPESPAYIWKNDEFEEREVELKCPNGLRVSILMEADEKRAIFGALSRELFGRCLYCPLPLSLDGKRVNGFSHDPRSGVLSGERIPFAQRFWESEQKWFSRFSLVAGIDETALKLAETLLWSNLDPFPKNCSFAVFLTAKLDGSPQPSFLLWTYQGVVVHREVLPALGCIGATMILCGDDLSVDLSGLNLIEGQLFEVQRREALVVGKQALLELAESSAGFVFEEQESAWEMALALIGMRKRSVPHLDSVELNILASHLGQLGTRYWSP